ncbi:hypothetical protein FACS1894204_07860 [Synergistales bacterium]|nr:hypothetical protein FACS1894204_07860 [Synergistales bacterium]
MNFEIYRPEEASWPLGWYATFDGYTVAQVEANHWVYGRVGLGGAIVMTEIPVGSVVPQAVPELARMAVSHWRGGAYETKAFRKIALAGYDNMGVLDDPIVYTPVVWKTGQSGLRVWVGDRWVRVEGDLSKERDYLARLIREKNIPWTLSDTEELVYLAREWGYIWRGVVPFNRFPSRPSGGGDGKQDSSTAAYGGGDGGDSSGGNWDGGGDVGGGGGGSGGGGGWDTGR